MAQKGLLRYRIDLISILVVVATLGGQIAAYALHASPLVLIPLLLAVRALHLVEHNHSHLPIFRWRPLNELIGWCCYLSNGAPLEFYEESHVHNHHRFTQRFTPEERDWSSTFGFEGTRSPDVPVSRWYYALVFVTLTWLHCWIEVLRRPGSRLFRRAILSTAIVIGTTVVLIVRDPQAWLVFFGVPWALVYIFMGINNYDHHHGCALTSPYDSSMTDLRFPWRAFGFNIGYHVAHHVKPTMHWSQLPTFHAKIADKIPARNYIGGARPASAALPTL
jgi:fatty acid desaturase